MKFVLFCYLFFFLFVLLGLGGVGVGRLLICHCVVMHNNSAPVKSLPSYELKFPRKRLCIDLFYCPTVKGSEPEHSSFSNDVECGYTMTNHCGILYK